MDGCIYTCIYIWKLHAYIHFDRKHIIIITAMDGISTHIT